MEIKNNKEYKLAWKVYELASKVHELQPNTLTETELWYWIDVISQYNAVKAGIESGHGHSYGDKK